MKLKHYQRICADINLDAVLHNAHVLHEKAPHAQVMGVVKTDGYGHGAVPLAKELEPLPFMYGFATATAEEAFCLRMAGIKKPLLVLGYVFPYAYSPLIGQNIRMTLFEEEARKAISEEAKGQGKKAVVHVKVDTGMSRIGIQPDQAGLEFLGRILQDEHLQLEGIFTHFAKADECEKADAYEQFRVFSEFCKKAEEQYHVRIPCKHCANSAAILEMPSTCMDAVRAGISLYGLWPSEGIRRSSGDLHPAFSLHSHIVYIKTLPAGRPISYGGTFVTHRSTRVATIPVGYGDGYPRSLSGRGHVLIHGERAPILGRICMDQFMVDVTDIPSAVSGDRVTLIGRDGNREITMEEMGELSDRFNYELVSIIGKRVPRVYYKNGVPCYAKDYFDDYHFDEIS